MTSLSTESEKLYEVQRVLEQHGALDFCATILCKITQHIGRPVFIYKTDSAAEFERQIKMLYAHWDYTVIDGDLQFTAKPISYEDRTVPVFTFNKEIPQIMMAVTRGLDGSDRWLILMYDPLFQITF